MPLFHGKMWLIVGAITHIRLARARVYWLWAAHCRVAQLNRRHSVAPYEYQNPITGEYVSSLLFANPPFNQKITICIRKSPIYLENHAFSLRKSPIYAKNTRFLFANSTFMRKSRFLFENPTFNENHAFSQIRHLSKNHAFSLQESSI